MTYLCATGASRWTTNPLNHLLNTQSKGKVDTMVSSGGKKRFENIIMLADRRLIYVCTYICIYCVCKIGWVTKIRLCVCGCECACVCVCAPVWILRKMQYTSGVNICTLANLKAFYSTLNRQPVRGASNFRKHFTLATLDATTLM